MGGKDAEKLTGREYETKIYNSANVLLKDMVYDWNWVTTGQDYGLPLPWSSDGKGDGLPLAQSYGVAASVSNIYVTDYDNSSARVQKFDSNGVFITKWGALGSGDGQFSEPIGIALDNGGFVYVADSGNNRIQKFSSNGALQGWFGKDNEGGVDWHGPNSGRYGVQGDGDGEFHTPTGLAVSTDGFIYVADAENDRIQKFNSGGVQLGWFGKDENGDIRWHDRGSGKHGVSGSENGAFNQPVDVAVDSNGNVYVADRQNSRVQKFDPNGNYMDQWGGSGDSNGKFYAPRGIAVDSAGNVYVNDETARVQKFDSEGNYISKWVLPSTVRDNAVASTSLYAIRSLVIQNGVYQYTRNWAVRLNQVDEITGNDGVGYKTSSTRYAYDAYGNVVTEYLDGDLDPNANDDATVWRVFYPNTTANIVSKPARERVYAGNKTSDDGTNLKKETVYYYDGHNDPVQYPPLTTAPTKGNVTRLQQSKDASTSVSSYYTYDHDDIGLAWGGNRLSETDPNGNQTSWTYDTTYHTYPARKTYPITSLFETYTYDPGTTNLWSLTDVNGQETTYNYDIFKRLTMVIKPGDSYINPSVKYQYNDWGIINQQHIKTETKIADGDYLWQKEYFDGMGRVVQTHARGESGHTIIASTTSYDSLGLVGRWLMDEGSGGWALDSSGQGNPGSLSGATWVQRKYGYGLQFDGSDDYVDLGNGSGLDIPDNTTSVSVEMWVNADTQTWNYPMPFTKGGYGTNIPGYYIGGYADPDRNKMRFGISDGGGQGTDTASSPPTPALNDGQWHHLVGYADRTRGMIGIYLDGTLVGENSIPGTVGPLSSSWAASIGGDGAIYNFKGKIDGVRVYKKALSATEVAARYAGYLAEEGEATVHYYLGDKEVAFRKGATLEYVHQDHLTGTSVVSSSTGALVSSIRFYPYGVTRSGSVPTDRQFTGQRLDGTGLSFDGSDNYVGAGSNASLDIPDAYTSMTVGMCV